eukprot:1278828-Rhodomonas_salina.2
MWQQPARSPVSLQELRGQRLVSSTDEPALLPDPVSCTSFFRKEAVRGQYYRFPNGTVIPDVVDFYYPFYRPTQANSGIRIPSGCCCLDSMAIPDGGGFAAEAGGSDGFVAFVSQQ